MPIEPSNARFPASNDVWSSIDIEDLAQGRVVGRKRDGRGIYDPSAKQALVEICRRPGVSVAKAARECGINANLLATCLRKSERTLADVIDVGADSLAAALLSNPGSHPVAGSSVAGLNGLRIGANLWLT